MDFLARGGKTVHLEQEVLDRNAGAKHYGGSAARVRVN
jgi:hypothetical protein